MHIHYRDEWNCSFKQKSIIKRHLTYRYSELDIEDVKINERLLIFFRNASGCLLSILLFLKRGDNLINC